MKKAGKVLVLTGGIVHICITFVTLLVLLLVLAFANVSSDYQLQGLIIVIAVWSVINICLSIANLILSIANFRKDNPSFGSVLAMLIISIVSIIFSVISFVFPIGLVAVIIGSVFLLIVEGTSDDGVEKVNHMS